MMFKLARITEFMLSVLSGSNIKPQLSFNLPPFNHNHYKPNNNNINFNSVEHFLKENIAKNNKQSSLYRQPSQHTTLSKEKWKIVFRKSERELNNNKQQTDNNKAKKIHEVSFEEEKSGELAINMETSSNMEPEDSIYNNQHQKVHSTAINNNDNSIQVQQETTSDSSNSSYYSVLYNEFDTSFSDQLQEDNNEEITIKKVEQTTNSISEKSDNKINQHVADDQFPANKEASLRDNSTNNDQQNNSNSTTFICGKPVEEWWIEQYEKMQESLLKEFDTTTSAHHIQQEENQVRQQQRQEENDLQLQIVKQQQVLFDQIQNQFELQEVQRQRIQDEKTKQKQIQEQFERQKQLEVNQRQHQQQHQHLQQQQQHFDHEEHYYEQQQFDHFRQQRHLWNNNPVHDYKLFQPYPVIMNNNDQQQIHHPPVPLYNNFQGQHHNLPHPNQRVVEEPVFTTSLQELNNTNNKIRRETFSRREQLNRISNENNRPNIIQALVPQQQNMIIPAPPLPRQNIIPTLQQEQKTAGNIDTNDTNRNKAIKDADDLLTRMNEKIALLEKICGKKPGFDITQQIPATAITVSQLDRNQKEALRKKQIKQQEEARQMNEPNDIHEKFRKLVEDLKNFDPGNYSKKEKHQELIKKMDAAKHYFIEAIFGNDNTTMITKSMEKEIAFSLCKHFLPKEEEDVQEEKQIHSAIPPQELCILGVTHNNQDIADTLTLQQYKIFKNRQQNIAREIREIMPDQNLFVYHGEFKDYYDCGNRILGEGLNGCVINGFCKRDPERTEVAIKNITLDIDKEHINEFIISGTLIEISATTKATNHPNIIRTQMVFLKDNRLTLVLELMHGSVKNLMDKAVYTNTMFSVGQVVYIALEILKALTYLHEHVGLLHGDIKSDNILINRDGQVKLSDFGLSKSSRIEALEVSGTAQWMAPEVADRERYSNEKSDIWSLGMTLIELIDLEIPGNDRFGDANLQNPEEIIKIIAHSTRVPSFKRPNFSRVLHSIMMKHMLCLNPKQRLASSQLEHLLKFSIGTGELACCTKEEMADFVSRMVNRNHHNKK